MFALLHQFVIVSQELFVCKHSILTERESEDDLLLRMLAERCETLCTCDFRLFSSDLSVCLISWSGSLLSSTAVTCASPTDSTDSTGSRTGERMAVSDCNSEETLLQISWGGWLSGCSSHEGSSRDDGGRSESEFGIWSMGSWDAIAGPWASLSEPLKVAFSEN